MSDVYLDDDELIAAFEPLERKEAERIAREARIEAVRLAEEWRKIDLARAIEMEIGAANRLPGLGPRADLGRPRRGVGESRRSDRSRDVAVVRREGRSGGGGQRGNDGRARRRAHLAEARAGQD